MVGIMIGLWDLTTAANRCQESMKLIYGERDVAGVDSVESLWAKGVVWGKSGPAVDVVIVYGAAPSWAQGEFKERTQQMMELPQLVMFSNHRGHYIQHYQRAQSTSHPVI